MIATADILAPHRQQPTFLPTRYIGGETSITVSIGYIDVCMEVAPDWSIDLPEARPQGANKDQPPPRLPPRLVVPSSGYPDLDIVMVEVRVEA